jgi:N-acylneuraminate cytidylyltransferase
MNDIIAIIPARSGSKSIKDKNIVDVAGFPLLAYSIVVAKMSQHISRVLVSTDSKEYADVALRYGAEVPFLRPKECATDTCTDKGFLVHAMNWLQEHEHEVPELWVHLRPTTPLRDPKIIDQAINKFLISPAATSLRSGHLAPESPLKWFQINQKGYFKGLLSSDDKESYNMPKEAFSNVYIPDGYVDIVRHSHVLPSDNIHGINMLGFESPVCSEVDSQEELEYIRYQIDKNGSELLEHLKSKI